MVTPELAIHFVRSLILEETATDFARLRRVPSTHTWRCLDRLAAISSSRRETLFDDIAPRAPIHLGLQPPPARWQSSELTHFYDEVSQTPSLHVPSRLLRGMVASKRLDGPKGYFSQMPGALVERADSIRPTTASKIRKNVQTIFREYFAAAPQNLGGGTWLYRGGSQGRSFAVPIDYGGRGDQLRYYVQLSDAATGLRTKTLNFETLLGLGFGQWDFVTADSQLRDIQLLAELIADLVAIPDRLSGFGSA